jgi:hypothetical protein
MSADGRFLGHSWTWASGFLEVWEVATGRRILHFEQAPTEHGFAPDGSALYGAVDGVPQAHLLPGGNGWRAFQPARVAMTRGFTLSPDGRRVALTSYMMPRAAAVWDTADGRVLAQYNLPKPVRSCPALAPDGRLLLPVASPGPEDAPVSLLDPAAGRTLGRLTWPWPSAIHESLRPLVAPDGWSLALANQPLLVWPMPGTGGAAGRVHLEGHAVSRCAWLPDGGLVTFYWREGTINVWPAEVFRW